MFTIRYIFYTTIPALSTVHALVALFGRWAVVSVVVHDCGRPGPALNRPLVYHMRGLPYDQVFWNHFWIHEFKKFSFSCWQPVTGQGRLLAYFKDGLKVHGALDVS